MDDNLEDLELMDRAHREGTRYTYTVMNTDETQTLGCIYLLPNDDRMYRTAQVTSHDGTDLAGVDATMSFWVRVSTWEDGFERTLLEAVLGWLRDKDMYTTQARSARSDPVKPGQGGGAGWACQVSTRWRAKASEVSQATVALAASTASFADW